MPKQTMTRADFDTLDPSEKPSVARTFRIIDEVQLKAPVRLRDGQMSRDEWNALDQSKRLAVVRAGTAMVDIASSGDEGPGPGFRKAPDGIGWIKE